MTESVGGEGAPNLAEFREEARSWISDNLAVRDPAAKPMTIEDFTPEVMAANRVLQRKLYDGGYAGISLPIAYGGRGLPPEYARAFVEDAAEYVTPNFGTLSATTNRVCLPTMLAHASDELLKQLVPEVLSGQSLICQFFSEPSSGSDLAGARTTATQKGDNWVINGQKTWSTFAQLADYGLCLTRTNWDAPKHRGLTWFLVPCNAPGVTIRPIRQILGSRGSFCDDFFDDVAVPDRNRIGEVNAGWTVTQTMLKFERGGGHSAGLAEFRGPGPIDPAIVALARDNATLSDPVVRDKIARIHATDFVGTALHDQIARASRSELGAALASYGKLFRGTYDPIRARLMVEIGGWRGMTWSADDPDGPDRAIEYLDGRHTSIAGGTNEMQRNSISERVLGMPREPSYDREGSFREVLRNAAQWGRGTS